MIQIEGQLTSKLCRQETHKYSRDADIIMQIMYYDATGWGKVARGLHFSKVTAQMSATHLLCFFSL